jgi:DNA-binding response OmpR family regulator
MCYLWSGKGVWYTLVVKFLNRFKKILIVEDDPALQKALIQKCERKGFKVISLSSGKDVLNTVAFEKPSGMLLDLMLPIYDGMDLLKRLRGVEVGYHNPVVILTNLHGQSTLRDEAAILGAQYFDKAETPIDKAVEALVKQL